MIDKVPFQGTNSFGQFLSWMEGSECKELRLRLDFTGTPGCTTGTPGYSRTKLQLEGVCYLPGKSLGYYRFEKFFPTKGEVDKQAIKSRLESKGFQVVDGYWTEQEMLDYVNATVWMDGSVAEFAKPAELAPKPAAVVGYAAATTKARDFAIKCHGDQEYGNEPYVMHLDAVAEIVRPYGDIAGTVAYLHDVLEDTYTPRQELVDQFGAPVAELVQLITDEPILDRDERKMWANRKLDSIDAKTHGIALIVKVADRLANVRACLKNKDVSKFIMYQNEHPAFKRAAFRQYLCDEIWSELGKLLFPKRAQLLPEHVEMGFHEGN